MINNDLLNQILTCFNEYEQDLNKIVIKKNGNILTLCGDGNYLIYEIVSEYGSREYGCIENFETFLEIAEEFIDKDIEEQIKCIYENELDSGEYSNYGFFRKK